MWPPPPATANRPAVFGLKGKFRKLGYTWEKEQTDPQFFSFSSGGGAANSKTRSLDLMLGREHSLKWFQQQSVSLVDEASGLNQTQDNQTLDWSLKRTDWSLAYARKTASSTCNQNSGNTDQSFAAALSGGQ